MSKQKFNLPLFCSTVIRLCLAFTEASNVSTFSRSYSFTSAATLSRMSSGEGDRVQVLLWGLLGSDGTDILLSSARYLYFCNNNITYYFHKIWCISANRYCTEKTVNVRNFKKVLMSWLNQIHNPLHIFLKSTKLWKKVFYVWCTFIRWQSLTWTDVILFVVLFLSPPVWT